MNITFLLIKIEKPAWCHFKALDELFFVMYVHTHSRTYLRAGARARRTYALTKKVLKIVNFNMDLSKIDTYYNQITSNAMR